MKKELFTENRTESHAVSDAHLLFSGCAYQMINLKKRGDWKRAIVALHQNMTINVPESEVKLDEPINHVAIDSSSKVA